MYLIQLSRNNKDRYKTISTAESLAEALEKLYATEAKAPQRKRIKDSEGKTIKRITL